MGGTLIIGISDKKEIFGILNDLKTLNKQNEDTYTQFITNLISSYLGVEYCSIVKINFATIDNKNICILEAEKSSKPVFYRHGKETKFYIRTNNSTRELNTEETYKYIQSHW